MKKFWKVLGLTALAAALVPYRVRRDDETGQQTVEALLWQVTRGPGEDQTHQQIDVSLGFKSPFQAIREEKKLFTNNPQEAALFADDEPEAAAVPEIDPAPAAQPEEPTKAAEPEATEEDFDPDL